MVSHKRLFTLLVMFLFLACGNRNKSIEEIQKDWLVFENNDYSIKYPSGWALNQSGYQGSSFLLISKQISIRDFYQENVSLHEEDLPDETIDLNTYVQQAVHELQDSVINFELLENKQLVSGEDIFYKVVYTGIEIKHRVTIEKHFRIKNSKAYILTFSCKSVEINRYKPIGEGILNSFSLKN